MICFEKNLGLKKKHILYLNKFQEDLLMMQINMIYLKDLIKKQLV